MAAVTKIASVPEAVGKVISIEMALEAYRIIALQSHKKWYQSSSEHSEFYVKYRELPEDAVAVMLHWLADDADVPNRPEDIHQAYMQALVRSEQEPVRVAEPVGFVHASITEALPSPLQALWVFKGYYYSVKGVYTNDEQRLLVLEEFDKERKRFEQLKLKYDPKLPNSEDAYLRQRIPERVRIEVWRRDGGKCARCGSRENLEYDHIVPVSRGGSNTARNIELLCEKCNRSKSNNIA